MKIPPLVTVALIPAMLTACGPGGMTKSDAGTVLGAVAGGVIGNQFGKGGGRVAATAFGAVVGGIVGNEIGRSLDETDRLAATRAEYQALENGATGRAVPWRNPDSGRYGRVVPKAPYQVGSRYCRQFTHTVYIDGRPEIMNGRACRNGDGSWQNVG